MQKKNIIVYNNIVLKNSIKVFNKKIWYIKLVTCLCRVMLMHIYSKTIITNSENYSLLITGIKRMLKQIVFILGALSFYS